MFDLRRFRILAQNANQFGISPGEQQTVLVGLSSVTDEELDEFEASFPPPKPDEAAKKREDVRLKDGEKAKGEIAKEKKEKPHLHIPRDKDGNIKAAKE